MPARAVTLGSMRTANRLLFCALLVCGGLPAGVAEDAPAFVITANRLELPAPIGFAADSTTLTAESAPALAHIAAFLANKPAISTLRIEAHSDDQGDAAAALALTRSRALAVVTALVARGVARERLIAVGFGASKPVADAATPEGRAANRRIVAQIAALRGHALGGEPVDGGGSVVAETAP
jgi:OOP family OmpA-OmpF porin